MWFQDRWRDKMNQKITILMLSILLLFFPTAQATFAYWEYSPEDGEQGVPYWEDNVSTCLWISLPRGNATINFSWWNGTSFNLYNSTELNTTGTFTICANNSNFTDCGTEYHWHVDVYWEYEAQGSPVWYNTSANYTFITENCSVLSIRPLNESCCICPCCNSLCVTIYSENGSFMNLTFLSNYTTSWAPLLYQYFNNLTNGTYCLCTPELAMYNHIYYWNVTVDDGYINQTSDTYWFTTANSSDDCFCGNLTEAIEEEGIFTYKPYIIGLLGLIGLAGLGLRKWRKR